MYNIRYHIATLVAVFLALALGLFLGAAIVQGGTARKGGQALVDGLKTEFSDLRSENKTLTSSLQHEQALGSYLTEQWVADRLLNKEILLIATDKEDKGFEEAQSAISLAGGKPVVLLLKKPITKEILVENSIDVGIDANSAALEDLRVELAKKILAESSAPAKERPTLAALNKAGLVSFEGGEEPVALFGAVNIASHGDTADALAFEISAQLVSAGKPAVAGKMLDSKSDITVSAPQGVSTLDALDKTFGIQGIVALLTGSPVGNYGPAQSQDNWFPKIP